MSKITYTIEQLEAVHTFAKEKNIYENFDAVERFFNILKIREFEIGDKKESVQITAQFPPVIPIEPSQKINKSVVDEDIPFGPCANVKCPTIVDTTLPISWNENNYCSRKCQKAAYMQEYFKKNPQKVHPYAKEKKAEIVKQTFVHDLTTQAGKREATIKAEQEKFSSIVFAYCANPKCHKPNAGKYVAGSGVTQMGLAFCSQRCADECRPVRKEYPPNFTGEKVI